MARLVSIKKAAKITDTIMYTLIKEFPDFQKEEQVINFLKQQIKLHKVKFSFPPIIASGKYASSLHYKPTNRYLKPGFCVIDIGVKYKGYCADMSRTIYIGKPNKKEKEMYQKVLETQKSVIRKTKPGIDPIELHLLAKKKLGKRFIHAIGHGIAKKVHDQPLISKKKPTKLKTNDVFCIEPGLYSKNRYGIRIEDMVLVKNKPILLTKTPRKLITIKK